MRSFESEDAEICDAFKREGLSIQSLWDLLNRNDYQKMVPFLVDFLAKAENDKTYEGIARALTMKGLDNSVTIALTQRIQRPMDDGTAWVFGNAISITATEKNFEDVLQLLSNPSLGSGRKMLCECLGRIGKKQKDRTFNALQLLLADPDLVGQVVCGFYKLGDPRAIELIRPYLTHEHRWISKKTAATIKKLEKILEKPNGK